ncbi:MAG: MATE family efflux transporter [Candidatus Hydrogenedentes bacterium]|nr:MATE family efflux transporter [Candidatus Hydrogenedentota bacterium]
MDDRRYELGNEKIGKLLLRYALPASVGMFANSLNGIIDTIFVGNTEHGTLALAALVVSSPIQMLILAIGMTVGVGTASVISRSLGSGNQRRAERAAGTSFTTVAFFGLVMVLLGYAFLTPLLRLFAATDAVLPFAHQYLSILLVGTCFFSFAISCNNVVRSEGNVKIAMIAMLIGATVNIILDPILIFGLDMGIRGAAWANVASSLCSFSYLCRYFISGKSMLRIRRADLIPDLTILAEILRIGAVSFVRMAAGSAMAIIINRSIIYYGTDTHLAIFGVANRALSFFYMPLFGLVQGLQPIVGFNYGARNLSRVKKAVHASAIVGTAIASAGFLVVMIFTRPMLDLFSNDPAMIDEGVNIVRITIICMPCAGLTMVGGSFFQAIGKALPALVLTMSRQILFLIPMILILPRYLGLLGIWVSLPVAELVSVILTTAWVIYEMRAFRPQPPPIYVPEHESLDTGPEPASSRGTGSG